MDKKYINKEECRKIQISILEKIDEICDEHKLCYSLCGGTMLGAVRHSGFIPWDDDIDIFMLRSDYEKLINIIKNQKKYDWLSIVDGDQEGYYYTFAKAVDNRTVAKMEDNVTQHGLWVDIFPEDNVPNNKLKRNYFIKKCQFLRSIVISMTTDFSSEKGDNKIKIKKILNLCANVIGKKRISNYYKKIVKKYQGKNYKYVASLFTPYGTRDVLNKEIFSKRKLYTFEDKEFYGLEDYDIYLSNVYGDYMKLPPIDERKEHNIVAWWRN